MAATVYEREICLASNLRQLFIILQVNLYSLFPLLGVLHIDDIKLSNTPIFDFIPNQDGCTVDCK